MWIQDESGDSSCTLRGITYTGRFHAIYEEWLGFDGNRVHYTEPFKGRRATLIYFTIDSSETLFVIP